MKIIFSPAKKMVEEDWIDSTSSPVFKDKAEIVLSYLKSLSYSELKTLYGCNDKIAKENYERLKVTSLDRAYSPAILSYSGIAYNYLAPKVLEENELDYLQNHLYILSAVYGVLKPMDNIILYRLEMNNPAKINGYNSMYDFWKDDIYKYVTKDDHVILNLASEEYAKSIRRYLTDEDKFVDVIFGEFINNQVVEKGVYCKMARGSMVRWLAINKINKIEEIKKFNELGYKFNKDLSSNNKYVFIKKVT